ncbi:histidine kinase [Candidatus Magnetomorum sp. HK-1]|nr:histidine kinase [Candidatus Magnetomorum sp. HK-1]
MKENHKDEIQTDFAPPERLPMDIIQKQADRFIQNDLTSPAMHTVMNTIPDFLLVLNIKRQVIFCNERFVNLLAADSKNDIYSYRPGELLNCIHANKNKGGCGTTRFCRKCGAVNAIINGLSGKSDVQECRIIQKNTGNAMVFRVWTSPIEIDNEIFCIMVVADIAHEKRRRALERIFFHDILNTASSLNGCIEVIKDSGPELYPEFSDLIEKLSNKIIEEINAQRELSAAENNELTVEYKEHISSLILDESKGSYSANPVAKNRYINIDPSSTNIKFKTDRILIGRVISNMIKNALEAIPENDTVTIGCKQEDKEIFFWVHNQTFIPEDIQLQIFQRSFSTKGAGRGLGTHSIKLLTERYLKGKVTFDSKESSGTIFKIYLPLDLKT